VPAVLHGPGLLASSWDAIPPTFKLIVLFRSEEPGAAEFVTPKAKKALNPRKVA
jgi:hypothetical protein